MFDFGLDKDEFVGGKSSQCEGLLIYFIRLNQLEKLYGYLEQERDFIKWRTFPLSY